MHVGLLTARFPREKSFEAIAEWAAAAGFAALEVHTNHLPPADVLADGGVRVREILARTGRRISSLAQYSVINGNVSPARFSADMRQTLAAAKALAHLSQFV